MRFTATVLSIFAAASAVVADFNDFSQKVRARQEFMAAMHSRPQVAAGRKLGRAEKLRMLNDKLIKASRKLEQAAQEEAAEEEQQQEQEQQDGYLYDEEGNMYYQGEDGLYYTADGQEVQPDQYGIYPWETDRVPFDMSSRSFKYAGCAAIKSYDVDRAYENGNPMVVDTYAVFRLCPSDSCNPYTVNGCNKNYGEYTVEMKTYLQYLLQYYDERYNEYCHYCSPCDYDQKQLAHQDLQLCRQNMNDMDFYMMQQMHQQAYEDFIAVNGQSAGSSFGSNSPYNNGQGFNAYDGQYYNGANKNQNQANNYNGGDLSASYNNTSYMNQMNNYNNQNYNASYGGYAAGNGGRRGRRMEEAQQQYNEYQNQQQEQYNEYQNYQQEQYQNQQEYQNQQYEQYQNQYEQQYEQNQQYMQDMYEQYHNEGYIYAEENSAAYQQCRAFLDEMQAKYVYYAPQQYQQDQQQNQDEQQQQGQNAYNRYGNYYDEDGNFDNSAYQSGNSWNQAQFQNGGEFAYTNQNAAEYWYNMDCCLDGSICDFCQIQVEQYYGVCDSYVCGDYYTYCMSNYYGENTNLYGDDNFGGEDGESQSYFEYQYQWQQQQQEQNGNQDEEYEYEVREGQIDLMQYLECAEYENPYGQIYYIGPHCGDDHYTVSLGVFSDENCLNYVGQSVTLSEVLGYQYSNDDLFQFPKECISCDGVEEYQDEEQQQAEEEAQQNMGLYGQYVSAPDTTQDGIVAMCSSLYQFSAQCNKKMNNFDQIARLMTEEELAQEDSVCTFIDNIQFGSYDESGDITLRPDTFDVADWRNPQQYKKLSIPADQAVYLSLSIVVFIAMMAAAIAHHRMVYRQRSPWTPKFRPASIPIEKKNSGITMERERSGAPAGGLSGDYKPPAEGVSA